MQIPMLVYHRGRHGADIGIAESTLPAITRALEEGARAIEVDVRLHRSSGNLYVLHDPSLERTTNGRGKLDDQDQNTLDQCITAYGAKLPTLREVYEAIGERAIIVLDIKSPDAAIPAIELYVSTVLHGKPKPEANILASSFHHQTMTNLSMRYPWLQSRVIMDCVPTPPYLMMLAQCGIRGIHLALDAALMDADGGYELRNCARALGLTIGIWTVNDVVSFYDACAYGADAIFTDRPDILARLDSNA